MPIWEKAGLVPQSSPNTQKVHSLGPTVLTAAFSAVNNENSNPHGFWRELCLLMSLYFKVLHTGKFHCRIKANFLSFYPPLHWEERKLCSLRLGEEWRDSGKKASNPTPKGSGSFPWLKGDAHYRELGKLGIAKGSQTCSLKNCICFRLNFYDPFKKKRGGWGVKKENEPNYTDRGFASTIFPFFLREGHTWYYFSYFWNRRLDLFVTQPLDTQIFLSYF